MARQHRPQRADPGSGGALSDDQSAVPAELPPGLDTAFEAWLKECQPIGRTLSAESRVTVREAVKLTSVAERTFRRYIAEGILPTEAIQGNRGKEHRIPLPSLFLALERRKPAFERSASSPVADMARQMEALQHAYEAERETLRAQLIADRDKMQNLLTQQLKEGQRVQTAFMEAIALQTKTIDELRAEVRDSRAQVGQLQEQMVRALMPPKKPTLWERIAGKTKSDS